MPLTEAEKHQKINETMQRKIMPASEGLLQQLLANLVLLTESDLSDRVRTLISDFCQSTVTVFCRELVEELVNEKKSSEEIIYAFKRGILNKFNALSVDLPLNPPEFNEFKQVFIQWANENLKDFNVEFTSANTKTRMPYSFINSVHPCYQKYSIVTEDNGQFDLRLGKYHRGNVRSRDKFKDEQGFAEFWKKSASEQRSPWKIHFSVHPDDLEKAWDAVFAPILLAEAASTFKVSRISALDARSEYIRHASNPLNLTQAQQNLGVQDAQRVKNGMQVTLYIGEGEEKLYQSLAEEIETKLLNEKIRPGVIHQSDKPLGLYGSFRMETRNDVYVGYEKDPFYTDFSLPDAFHFIAYDREKVQKIDWAGIDLENHLKRAEAQWQFFNTEHTDKVQAKCVYRLTKDYFLGWQRIINIMGDKWPSNEKFDEFSQMVLSRARMFTKRHRAAASLIGVGKKFKHLASGAIKDVLHTVSTRKTVEIAQDGANFLEKKNLEAVKSKLAAGDWYLSAAKADKAVFKKHKVGKFTVKQDHISTKDNNEQVFRAMIIAFKENSSGARMRLTVKDEVMREQVERICRDLGVVDYKMRVLGADQVSGFTRS